MKIMVTGDKGYLGSEFVKRYSSQFEVIGFDHKSGDELSDLEKLTEKAKECEYIVHLAAIPKPVVGKSFDDYINNNVLATHNVIKAAMAVGAKRVIYASSTTIYGIERGIPFKKPIKESQLFVSQYLKSSDLQCRDIDLSYHISKVMAEQILAWYGLNKKIQTVALRFGPINKVFLNTSVSINNAAQAIKKAIDYEGELWYEAFSIVDEIPHIDISKAKAILGYDPEKPIYTKDQIH
ncbi:MAG: NAD-dependent epimerase/dehydratase family protein [Patescibacteria group bacterium]